MINKQSETSAYAWTALFNSGYFRQENDPRWEYKRMLPYPIEDEEEQSKNFSKRTIAIIQALAKANKIPPRIHLILRSIEELKL